MSNANPYRAQKEIDDCWNHLFESCVMLNDNFIYFYNSNDSQEYFHDSMEEKIIDVNQKYGTSITEATHSRPDNENRQASIQSWRPDYQTAKWELLYPPTEEDIKRKKAAIKKTKAKEARAFNKECDAELKHHWVWGNRIDLSKAVDVPADQVKLVLSRIVKPGKQMPM